MMEMIIVLLYVFRIDKVVCIKIRDFVKTGVKLFFAFVKRGLPVFFSNGIWGVAMAVQTAILGHMGQSAITANSIAVTLFQILSVVAYASANTSAVMISKTIGEKRYDDIKPYTVTMQLIFLAIGVVTGTLLFLSRNMVVSWYLISEQSKNLAFYLSSCCLSLS